ncbi:MAG: LysR family transcriptional regulator [Steroidobacteraceae bacterium]|nr:LysR family transcriptional regulator [Steroidobacteraceae bacterium]
MDRLDSMRMFVRVAELGSFSAVAQQLGVARSVVTRQVAALETHLGTRLMVRSTRRLSLTSAGTAYLEKCRVILNLVDAAETDAAEERAVARGNIRLGLPLSFGLKRLAPLLLEFAERHTEVSLEMDYTDRRLDLVEEGFDLSIRITSRLAPADVVRKLGTCQIITAAAPEYLARHGRPQRPADLAGHECLLYSGDSNPSVWTYGAGEKVESVYVRSRFTANNGDVLADAAARGLGITLQPDFIVQPYLQDGRLEQILGQARPPSLGIYALLPGGRHMPYRVRVLIEFLSERLRPATSGG